MTNYKRGDVVLTDVIYSERIAVKRRPALVLSSEEYHNSRQEMIIAAITSNIKRTLVGDTRIVDWKEAGLQYPSLVTGILQTIKQTMVLRKLGTLSPGDFHKVHGNLKKAMGL